MRAASIALLCAVAAVAAASAQPLPKLDVTAFTFAADTATPHQERPFHLVIDVRTAGRLGDPVGVVLPPLDTLEILGDEKHTVATANGSEYRETIAVVAHRTGTFAIAPAYLDAIDARDGKPKRFLSAALTFAVAGSPATVRGIGSRLRAGLASFGGFALGALVVAALAIAVLRLRRPPAPVVADVAPAAPPEEVALPSGDAIASARSRLAADPTRDGALAARASVWSMVGAGEGETLADVVRRPAAHDPSLRAVLRALERAAFTADADRPAAIDDALRALEGYRG